MPLLPVVFLVLTAAPGPADDQLLAMGRVATLAPLCRLRDDAWAADLRRAQVQQFTATPGTDDEQLRRAPRRAEAEAALGFADSEALEAFAADPPDATCGPLARSADLRDADETVRAFRAQRDGRPGS